MHIFAAIHVSFIVNLKHIKTFSGGQVILSDGTELTVSRGYKKSLTEKLKETKDRIYINVLTLDYLACTSEDIERLDDLC